MVNFSLLFCLIFLSCSPMDVNASSKIGLVEIEGPILTSREIVKDLNHFLHRDDIGAIVVRVDSPGGGVAPSQEIYNKIQSIKSNGEKPIVVSMGSVAASGGYYVSIGADSILANPGTITGSIGVIMSYPTVNELMQSLGVDFHLIKSGQYKDSGTPFRSASEKDEEYFMGIVKELYDQFIHDIIIERGIPHKEMTQIADGRVYSGRQALELGLIDKLGTFEDAVYLAGKMAGIKDRPKLVKPPVETMRIIDVIMGEVKVNLGLDKLWPIPEFRYR